MSNEPELVKPDQLSESERIKELRERLYARGDAPERSVRHALPARPVPSALLASAPETETKPRATPAAEEKAISPNTVQYGMSSVRRNSFRKKILILGLLFFVAAISLSSIFMFMGKNMISGQNISLEVIGPLTIGGGEEYSFQVVVANQNTIPIESATLIVEYPDGTHSMTDVNRELTVVREALDTIATDQVVNVPFKARIFGEENQEKEIRVSIDYRVEGSNATFKKEAEPLRFKVSSSPVIMSFDALKTVSSGQELTLALTVQSNSPSPLADVLVKMTFPDGFNFSTAEPDTLSGEDTWRIATLKPGEKKVITVKGLMTGYEDETESFTALAGVANTGDRTALGSVLAKAEVGVTIEKSFLNVSILVNGTAAEPTIMSSSDVASVEVRYTNALNTAIYDGEVLVELEGNALNEFNVKVSDGFYDSQNNTIRWDAVDVDLLKEILPGKTSTLGFTLDPKDSVGKAPEIKMKVTVRGSRPFEDRAPQELSGAAERTIKIESVHMLDNSTLHDTGPFTNTGPTPPVAEEVTQYTFNLVVLTGANDVTGAEVSAVLPQYVSWLDLVSEGDEVTYNQNTRTMKWIIGDMDANSSEEVGIQVSFLPSLSQVGTTPTLLNEQRFRATDRFTGTVVRAEHPALTTSLDDETDEDEKDGKVRAH